MPGERIYNFSAGPSVLPLSVLKRAAGEMTNYRGCGMSVMEMSHRSRVYLSIFEETKADLKRLLSVPDTHEILFMHGGATFQFSAVPLNLIGRTGYADYAVTGSFSAIAAEEARKYGVVRIAADTEASGHTTIPAQSELRVSGDASYFYYCANNTIYGTEWKYVPDTGDVPVIADMSSNILSVPLDISRFGVIFAGVQKNMAPAGMAVVIADRSLLDSQFPYTPKIMSYRAAVDADSMLNTPPCYTIYMLGLMLKWLEEQGGVEGMARIKSAKAKILYDFLDGSGLFRGCAAEAARSDMNVTFRTDGEELDAKFAKDAEAAGFANLKGHRKVGGMRASIYNAMPSEGVARLVDFMAKFERENG
ncbi:MAG: 3-phosphoserine/phosphohydroxythreonine transaminase [Oscillospiraceae bacterium]|jgi:phosphoserine aminotransferase|nr:3-phosphoserine/phosphohydroxythreonine transaminase [Oscillospiraceae bacterium]